MVYKTLQKVNTLSKSISLDLDLEIRLRFRPRKAQLKFKIQEKLEIQNPQSFSYQFSQTNFKNIKFQPIQPIYQLLTFNFSSKSSNIIIRISILNYNNGIYICAKYVFFTVIRVRAKILYIQFEDDRRYMGYGNQFHSEDQTTDITLLILQENFITECYIKKQSQIFSFTNSKHNSMHTKICYVCRCIFLAYLNISNRAQENQFTKNTMLQYTLVNSKSKGPRKSWQKIQINKNLKFSIRSKVAICIQIVTRQFEFQKFSVVGI
eukprot:TRINITY_DN3291_c0_g1_i5.p1 TRINITY_DN3291_c0_g1~~TRINITY_DN3291_c0_g1_i5.p1  ORF type:complete len:264 (+),score=-27.78 TRINITY_DN3291_c0_g1_i5:1512-2303(+)